MKSEVDFTLGLSCSIVVTGTPVWAEITPKVSPARTVQNRRGAVFFVLVVVAKVAVEVLAGAETVGAGFALLFPDWMPARTRTTATVTASSNAAGAR